MKKISTLFKKDPKDLGKVINEINPGNEWVLSENGVKSTRKFDGTACAIINGELYKRYDVKNGKQAPLGAIPCQEADLITGHHPHWIKCEREDNSNKWHFKAFDEALNLKDGTYELCGPKIQGNPENLNFHYLVEHGKHEVEFITDFELLKEYLTHNNIEGIVYHGFNGKMCKIRKSDFGIKR